MDHEDLLTVAKFDNKYNHYGFACDAFYIDVDKLEKWEALNEAA